MNALDKFAFVLFSPKHSGNVGAAARALKNMGVADLRLVAPRDYNPRAAAAMAVHADDVLERARIFPDLATALDDRTLTVGTTCRVGPYRSETRTLRDAAPTLIADGTADRLDPLANSHTLASLIPGAELTLYPDAGHAFLFQDQAAFIPLIESFLG